MAESFDLTRCLLRAMPGHHLQRHLPDPPRFITEGLKHGWARRVVPRIQEPSCAPDTQPVVRSGRFAGADPPSGRATECEDQFVVDRLAVQQVAAPIHNRGDPPPFTLLLDALPGVLSQCGGDFIAEA